MQRDGFEVSEKFPCVYFNPVRQLRVVTHVDDFLVGGPRHELDWLKQALEKEFELTSTIVGPEHDASLETKFLGRSIRWTNQGIEYGGDERHARALLDAYSMDTSRPVGTPGAVEDKSIKEDDLEETMLQKDRAKKFRVAAARLNYMALDRGDMSFAAKEVSRAMASLPRPTRSG